MKDEFMDINNGCFIKYTRQDLYNNFDTDKFLDNDFEEIFEELKKITGKKINPKYTHSGYTITDNRTVKDNLKLILEILKDFSKTVSIDEELPEEL